MVWEQRTCFLRLLKNCMEMFADGKNFTSDENSWNGELFMPIPGFRKIYLKIIFRLKRHHFACDDECLICSTGPDRSDNGLFHREIARFRTKGK